MWTIHSQRSEQHSHPAAESAEELEVAGSAVVVGIADTATAEESAGSAMDAGLVVPADY